MSYKLISLFAGIGGIDFGFEAAGFLPVWANEIDKSCAVTFKANHPNTDLLVGDINNIHATDIPQDITVIGGGFPCQPFSVAGHRLGFEDNRGGLFFQITRIITELAKEQRKPKIVFLENVKNLYTHNKGETFKQMQKELEDLGYYVKAKVLNTSEYGNLPQNRERLFIIAFSTKQYANAFVWPPKLPLTNSIDKVIDWNSKVDSKYYYTEKNKCYDLLEENIHKNHSIYQYRRVYVRENMSGLCPTLTANMGTGGHNVPLIRDDYGHIRKLTPKECLLLQGFPKDFIVPESLANSKIYKQAGNAVSVNVIKILAEQIKIALGNEKLNE